jgi:hypothetical protein
MLGMAKAFDDLNDSQFYISAIPLRSLDFSYTIFGVLTVGDAVRAAISAVGVDGNAQPLTEVVIESARVFQDTQNGVVLLKAPEGASGTAGVTITATDAGGLTAQQTFTVQVTPDTENSPPFLADIPELSTPIDTPLTFQLQAIDVEGDDAFYLDQYDLYNYGLTIPYVAPDDLGYEVDANTGEVTVTPANGLSGVQYFTVATGVHTEYIDYQVVPITIGDAAETGLAPAE